MSRNAPKGFASESARARPTKRTRAPQSRYSEARSPARSPRFSGGLQTAASLKVRFSGRYARAARLPIADFRQRQSARSSRNTPASLHREGHQMVDRTNGAVLRSARHRVDGRGFGTEVNRDARPAFR